MKKLLFLLLGFFFVLISCKKENEKQNEELKNEKVFIKVEAVNKNGDSDFSKIIYVK